MSTPPLKIAEYGAVDPARFQETIRPAGQPAVFRGLAAEWPAVVAARRSDEDLVAYLAALRPSQSALPLLVGPPEIDGRLFYNDDLSAMNFSGGTSPLMPFLEWLLRERRNPRPQAVAMQSQEVAKIVPGFDSENRVSLVGENAVPRAWIGNRLRVAPHYDLEENIGVVVAGRRRFILFPPDQLPNLYPGPFEFTPAGTPVSLVDPVDPALERFPKYAEAMRTAQTAELEPGDAIYIPFHWWHGVQSLEPFNLFINYWWNDAPPPGRHAYDALLFALYAIKGLPDDQRAALRTAFDHYVFGARGAAEDHIPQHARGVLSELDAKQYSRLRRMLREILQKI